MGSAATNVNGLIFGAWVFPGDVLQSAEVSITSSEFGGTTYFDQVVNFTQSGCSGNQYGFNVCTETGTLRTGQPGCRHLLAEPVERLVNDGDPIYWDENSGPSSASENSVGTIPSEVVHDSGREHRPRRPAGGSVPEPSSIMLFGSGILGLAGVLRRKLFLGSSERFSRRAAAPPRKSPP